MSSLAQTTFEIDVPALRRRLWQIIPGALSWGSLIGLTALALVVPFWIAIFVIAYDVYILVRVVYMSVHLIYAYRQLRRNQKVDWLARCRGVSGDIKAYAQTVAAAAKQARLAGQNDLATRLDIHGRELANIRRRRQPPFHWRQVHHAIVLPTYDESLAVLRSTLQALARSDFPKDRLHVVVGFEERAGQPARHRGQVLGQEFANTFGTFLTTWHPDGLPGEKRVKSANAVWAIKQLEATLQRRHIPVDHVVVSNFDSDTVVSPSYFSHLTYVFITHPDRWRVSYQPIPVYNNNLWDAPAFSRVIATGSTFWQMIESTRPERLVTFSSHSMSLKALKEVGYWHRDVVSEDSRIFWQCLIHYNGRYRTQPLYTTVSMDAALASTWWRTLVNQYKQKRRWAWGIENFPYFIEEFLRRPRLPLWTKLVYTFRTLEGHYSWATAPIIVAGLGWIPIFFGGPEFHSTVLSHTLPLMARTLMSIAMGGLVVSAALSMLLMPPRPAQYGRWRYVSLVLQWALVPIIATLLSAFPALDAETRLMLGRDLSFNVMEKARRDANNA